MLIGNGRLTDKVPMTFLGRDWNAQLQPASLAGCTSTENFGANQALPDGYYTPHGWMLPRKAGTIKAGLITGSGGVSSGTMQSGYNIAAGISGQGGITEATLGLIVSLLATITGSGGITTATANALATLVATITGSGSVNATLQGLARLNATITGSGNINANNTALATIAATIRGYGDLTPEGIRDSVWQALATQYNAAGTMGQKLNNAASGGVDYAALGEAVWAALQADQNVSGSMAELMKQIPDNVWNKTL
jgi:hypothetical protein